MVDDNKKSIWKKQIDALKAHMPKLSDAIIKYQENEIRLKEIEKNYQSSNPKIAKEIQLEIDKIKKVIKDLQFARNQLFHQQEILEEPDKKVKNEEVKVFAKEVNGELRVIAPVEDAPVVLTKEELEDILNKVKQDVEKIVKETEPQIKKKDTIELPVSVVEDIKQIKINTSHSKRNMFLTGLISFIAGILSTLAIQYTNNLNAG